MSQPGVAINNLGNLYLQGCQLAPSSASAFFVLPGQARNSTNVNDIVVGSLLDVNTALRGPGGLDQGTIEANTLYAVYVLGLSGSTGYSAVMSKSFSLPVMNGQYNMFRRVGAVATDDNGDIRPFYQIGQGVDRPMWYEDSVNIVLAGGLISYVAADCSALIPNGNIGCMGYFSASFIFPVLDSTLFLRPTGSNSTFGLAQVTCPGQEIPLYSPLVSLQCPVSAGAEIDYAVNFGAGFLSLFVAGYTDSL